MTNKEFQEVLNSDYIVRTSVADNPSTPTDVLAKLAEDSECNIRKCTDDNPKKTNLTLRITIELDKK